MEHLLIPLEFRQDESRDSPGLLSGVLMTYGEAANDRREMFDMGALHWREGGITIREQHNRDAGILRAIPYLEGKELRISAPLPNTSRGRDAATKLARADPVVHRLSVEFQSEAETRRNGLRVITRAFLAAAGLVDRASYLGSKVEVRESGLFRPWSVFAWL